MGKRVGITYRRATNQVVLSWLGTENSPGAFWVATKTGLSALTAFSAPSRELEDVRVGVDVAYAPTSNLMLGAMTWQ